MRKGGVLSGPYEDTNLAIGCLHKGKIPMQEIGREGLRKRGVFAGAYGTYIVTVLEVACRT